jgi:PAS domain S-box-containing protein
MTSSADRGGRLDGQGKCTDNPPEVAGANLAAADLEARVLSAIGEAVVVMDEAGRITALTGAAERVFGHRSEEVVGRSVSELLRGPIDPVEAITAATGEKADLVVPLEDGRPAAVSVRTLRDPSGGPTGAIAQIKPLGPWIDPAESGGWLRRQWHRTLGGLIRELVEVAGHDLGAVDDRAALARLLVGQARRLLPTAECMLSVVLSDRQDHFQILAGSGAWARRQVGREWPCEGTVAGQAMGERRAIETTILDRRSVLRGVLEDGGIQTGRLVPLLPERPLPDGRTALGVLGFYRRERAYFTPYERRLIDEFSRLVSLALQRAELRRSAAEMAARLRTGVEVAVDLGRSLQPRDVMRSLLQRAADAVDASRATLASVSGDHVVVEESWDRGPHADQVSQTLTLPLVLGGATTALLTVSRSRDQPFSREDAMTLQLVGNVAALAIGNARLFEQAQEASAARSDFLNMAAHELRTPLTVVSGYLSMFHDGTFGEPPRRWREPIKLLALKAHELGELIDDLLLASHLESGGLVARAERLDLRQAVRESADRARPMVDMLGGELVLELPDHPVEVRADAQDIARVLDNLVNNALTYRMRQARAWVRIFARLEDGTAVAGVEDHGRGIPPELRDRIFDRFVRGDAQDAADTPGTGLGLYICQQLAARHAGRVQLDASEPGHGSCFTLRLPHVTP